MQLNKRLNDTKANTDLLYKGALCTLIGLAVLIFPAFMPDGGMRATIAGASLVGWFAVVLGGVFLTQYSLRRWAATKQ